MRGWGWGRSSLFFHRAAKAHREFTQQSYIRKDRSRNRGTDYEPEHLGRIFPHTLQSPSLGLIRSVWQNVVATTRGLRIHQRCTTLAVISIRHTHTCTHTQDEAHLILMEESSTIVPASFRLLFPVSRRCHKCWSGWILNTHIVTLLNITQTEAKQKQMRTCVCV